MLTQMVSIDTPKECSLRGTLWSSETPHKTLLRPGEAAPLHGPLIEDNTALVSLGIDGVKPKGSLRIYRDSIVKLLGEKDWPSRG